MFETLSDEERTLVSARAEQFQTALIGNNVTDWEPFLSGLVGNARLILLTDFIVRDLGYRWGIGERPRVEDYLARYPELGPAEKIPAAIIIEEHRCRLRAGESVSATDYRDRFPAQFDALQTQLDAAIPMGTISETSVRRAEQAGATAPGTIQYESSPATEPMGTISEGTVRRATPLPDPSMGEISQQYDLLRELGRGMFGEVWLARKKSSGIEKAVKILLQAADRDAGQRELKSLELIKNLRHPYLLATEDFWISNNRLHIVMELAEGTLRNRLKVHQAQGNPGIPVDELFQYIAEAAEGLDFLHKQKVTHRDIKPDNILILHGHAKLADFGLARAQDQLVDAVSLAGTPAYMAPEIWAGEGGPASDLYSLAFAYIELRQGRSPLKPRPLVELMVAHQEGAYEFTETITESERAVLRVALSRKPHDRHPTCTDFVADLAHALGRPFATAPRRGPTRLLPTSFDIPGENGSGSVPVALDASSTAVIEPPLPKTRLWPLIAGGSVAAIALLALGILFLTNGTSTLPTDPSIAKNTSPPTDPGTKPPDNGNGKKPPDIPQTPKWVFPAGTTPEPGAKEVQLVGKTVPEWVFAETNGAKVRFRLITGGAGVPPFYIMETKVLNKHYGGGDNRPIMNVPAYQARAYAVKTFGGHLPSEEQWDYAAGFFDQQGQAGPTVPPGQAWVKQPVPGPANEADVNRYGLLDMAGNGREWTRTIITRNGERKLWGAEPLSDTDKLILRGRNFTLDRPLTYAMLDIERKTQPQAAAATVPSPYTGFRVVLQLPQN